MEFWLKGFKSRNSIDDNLGSFNQFFMLWHSLIGCLACTLLLMATLSDKLV